MPNEKYRIQKLTIEGFRGFTSEQTISLDGRNAFIFGTNGCGKSSIVEAIRWCLFGSPPGREIEVRNTFYPAGECSVSLVLARANSTLRLRRELRPGASRSRQTIKDGSGTELREQDALPQLARLGHQHGTQVIFSAQHSVGRQTQIDISDFTRVLCFYLNMETIPDLIEHLLKRVDSFTSVSEQMSAAIEKAEAQYRDKIKATDAVLSVLTANPPWGTNPPPTAEVTSKAISEFVESQARLHSQQRTDDTDGGGLDQARQWIEASQSRTAAELQKRIDAIRIKVVEARRLIQAAQVAEESIAAKCEELQVKATRRSALLGDASLEALITALNAKEQSFAIATARLSLLKSAGSVLTDWSDPACPVCGREHDREALLTKVDEDQLRITHESPDVTEVARLREIVAEAKKLADAEAELSDDLVQHQRTVDDAIGGLIALTGANGSKASDFEASVRAAQVDLEGIERELSDASAEHERRRKRIKDLESELRFHAERSKLERLRQRLTTGLDGARERLRDFLDRLASVRSLAGLLSGCFNEVLDRATPQLNEMMTAVYRRLTGQLSYDLVRVVNDPAQRDRRELRVATSRREGPTFAVNVLNGQAAKAIQLVPYFVFSRFLPDIMELDLLLIDDPSESFDTSHVGRLVDELGEAAKHAQLIVATHEEDKFRPFLKTAFGESSAMSISVTGFGPDEGPTIVVQ